MRRFLEGLVLPLSFRIFSFLRGLVFVAFFLGPYCAPSWLLLMFWRVRHCLLAIQRPIRHRGERRRLRERKNPIGLFGVAFNLKVPS